jgi:branched-chain amino acid transport system substrate-binding protein
VYRVEHEDTHKEYALKSLNRVISTTLDKRSFGSEVRILNLLGSRKHHIISLVDSDWNEGEPYLVMPLMAGSLYDRLMANGLNKPLPKHEAIPDIRRIASALLYAHEKYHIWHCDIKPKNVLYNDEGVVVADWGIAQEIYDPGQRGIFRRFFHRSRQGGLRAGTFPYKAPEQETSGAVAQSDQYALAVLSIELLTGYNGGSKELSESKKADALNTLKNEYPGYISIFERALSRESGKRYPSIRVFLKAFNKAKETQQWQESLPGSSTQTDNTPPARRTFFTGLSSGLVGGVLGALGVKELSLSLPSAPPAPTNIIKIGTDAPIQGAEHGNGFPIQNGVTMAILDANYSHVFDPYTFVMEPKDDTGLNAEHNADVGAKNVADLIRDASVVAIIGPMNSSVALKEIPVAADMRNPIALISPANTSPCLTVGDDHFCDSTSMAIQQIERKTYFRVVTLDNLQAIAIVNYFHSVLHYHTVGVIYDATDPYSMGLYYYVNDTCTKFGIHPSYLPLPSTSTKEAYSAGIMQTFASAVPNVMYYAGVAPGATNAWLAIQELPAFANTIFMGGDGILDATFRNVVLSNWVSTTQSIYATLAAQGSNEGDFRVRYQSYFSNDPYTQYAASSYTATEIVIAACQAVIKRGMLPARNSNDMAGGKRFRLALIDELSRKGPKPILYRPTGDVGFDDNGDSTNRTVSIYSLTGNNTYWQWVKDISPTSS